MINLLGALVGPVTDIISKAVPDKDQAAKLAHEISTMADQHAQELALAQIEVNKTEASAGWYRGGWRPAVGWICAAGFGVNFLVSPLAAGFGIAIPQADVGVMMPVLTGMLGLGTLRTFEKYKKADK